MDVHLAYLAGVLDSDGCINIDRWKDSRKKKRMQYIVRIQVSVTAKETTDWLEKHFDGSTRIVKREAPCRDIYYWRTSGMKAIELLMRVKDYLVLKRPRAELAIKFKDYLLTRKESRESSSEELRNKVKREKELIYNQMAVLNKRGK